jgi:hypothetical protein
MPAGDPMWNCIGCGRVYYSNVTLECPYCMNTPFESHGLMPRQRNWGGHPVSRDWADIDCKAVGCRFNQSEKCITPSRCKIGDNGSCTGFEAKPFDPQKVDGD